MKSFEERYTAWVDDLLEPAERERFERELPSGAAEERDAWLRLRGLLRETVEPAGMPHADFLNSQVLKGILREGAPEPAKRLERPLFPLRRLAFAGSFLIALAAVLSILFLSALQAPAPGSSQVVDARASTKTYAYTFDAPDKAAVLWIDNAGYIPATEKL